MSDLPLQCRILVAALVASADPMSLIPDEWPCTPLALLIALHQEVTRTMLSDLAHAQRAARAAMVVAQYFPDDPLLLAQALWSSGSARLYVPDYAGALTHYDQALEQYQRACDAASPSTPARDIRVVQIVRVFCLSELGRYPEALDAVEAAERWLADHRSDSARLTLLLNRSQLAGAMGEFAQMVDLADATIALATTLDETARVAQGLVNRAYACIYLGRFADADLALNKAMAVAAEADESLTLARAQCNRAWLLHCQGHLFAALTVLREAQKGLSQADGELATTSLEEAIIYEQIRQLPEALRAARFAAVQFAQQSMPTYSAEAALRAARYAMEQRQNGGASALLKMARDQADGARLPILNAQVVLAEAALAAMPRSDLSARALVHARKVARANAQQAITILAAHGMAQEIVSGQLTIAALDALLGASDAALAAYRCLAQHSNQQIQLKANAAIGGLHPPADALPYLQRAAALTVQLRRTLPMEELQARYSGETSRHHMDLAACYLALGDEQRAFETVCEAKAGALLDLRAASSALDPLTRALVETAKADIARWRELTHEHLRKAHSAAQQGQYEAATYHHQQAQTAAATAQVHEQELTARLRTLGDRQGVARVPTAKEVQAALTPEAALLEYVQLGDDLGCFLVRPQQPIIYRCLGAYGKLAPLLDRWNLVARRLMDDQYPADAQQQIKRVLAPFWDTLIAPWQEQLGGIQELLIAPYGILHHVPWAALWSGEQHLSDLMTLTLTPCGGLWAAPPIPSPASLGPPRLLSYAGTGARHLAHVAEEIAGIARHLPGAEIVVDATATDLRAASPPRLLHLAAHGLTNPAAPLCSTLELADGPLLLLEAHRLDLRGTELVTLSACETSVRPDHGDMALALSGAFLCAGARAVLASLWQVSDAATAALMEQFYFLLSTGLPREAALQQAQQYVRNQHPLDWAAFQIWAGAR